VLVELKATASDLKATSDGDGDVIEGYFSHYGNVDRVQDIVPAGAFDDTLKARAGRIVVKRNHSVLIGKPLELRSDSKGLWGALKISQTDGELGGKNTLTLARDGALKFGSIAYRPEDWHAEMVGGEEVRVLDRVELFELGPVDEAANESAVITGVKGREIALVLSDLPSMVLEAARAGEFTDAVADEYAGHFEDAAKRLRHFYEQKHLPHRAVGILKDALRRRFQPASAQ
jgi:HK97 family phage prohead protease